MKSKEAYAIFLPGKIHGCDGQLYILFYNPDAGDGRGCWEIGSIWYDEILNLFRSCKEDAHEFFEDLPFYCSWTYCDRGAYGYEDLESAYDTADMYYTFDGASGNDIMKRMVDWSSHRKK